MNKKIQALYGLMWNPFLPALPVEALWKPPHVDNFFFRVENLILDGGFALITGEAGLGKSKILQLLADRLNKIGDIIVGVMERPQSSLSDFYRELGELFGVPLSPANRYGGFKALRERWLNHIKRTLFRPILLIDEAQEMNMDCLNEIRLLGSAEFDSQCLLSTVLCGDMRLTERFRSKNLISLGSRIRVRMQLEPYSKKILAEYIEHSLNKAGAAHLMTQELIETLSEHAMGNLRALNTMSAELLERGAQKEVKRLDEKLFLEVFSRNKNSRSKISKEE